MKIFQTNQIYVEYGGFIRGHSAFNEHQRRTISKYTIFLILQYAFLFGVANTPRQYLNAIFKTTAGISIFISYIGVVLKTAKIFDYIDDVENVINERLKYPKSKVVHEKANRLVELISKFVQFIMVYVSPLVLMLPKIVFSFFRYFTTDLGRNAFELPYSIWLPFDWRNPIGYWIATVLQLILLSDSLRFVSYMMSFGIGGYLYGTSLMKELKDEIQSHNKIFNKKNASRSELLTRIGASIRFSNLKRLLSIFIEIYQSSLTVPFLCCTGAICLGMLMIPQEFVQSNGTDALMLFQSIFMGFSALNLVFAVCEFGQAFSNVYSKIGHTIYQMDWYLTPIKVQQTLLIMLINAQQPIDVTFFGSFSCSREQFKQVANKGYKSFMVPRGIHK